MAPMDDLRATSKVPRTHLALTSPYPSAHGFSVE